MSTKPQQWTTRAAGKEKKRHEATPTFQVELPVEVLQSQARSLHAHFEAGRQLYNAILSLGLRRLKRMRADPAWRFARAIPHTRKAERQAAFAVLRQNHGFSEYALQEAAKDLRTGWLAGHIEAVVAQTLATRAYRALQRVALGQTRRVRFKSRGRGLGSIENKRNDTGLRFVFVDQAELLELPASSGQDSVPRSCGPGAQKRARRKHHQRERYERKRGGQRSQGYVFWQGLQLRVHINWSDPVIAHALCHRIKYIRLLQRKASSPQAQGVDASGHIYVVQLVVEGVPLHKPKHVVGSDIIGADLGPSTIAVVARSGPASLEVFCAELSSKAEHTKAIRRLKRKMDRQLRTANSENYDTKGRIKKRGKGDKMPLRWKKSRGYERTRRRVATRERKRAAHRKSLHGRKVHEILAMGNTIVIEKVSYKAWQKQYGKSVSDRAPGMFVAQLRRTVASTGGTLLEVSTRTTRLSQFCHGCGVCVKKPRSERWHECACGIGPIQRDLYSAFLAAFLDVSDPDHLYPSCAQYQGYWEGVEARLRAAHEVVVQRANEGQVLPRSMGVPRARVRQLESLSDPPLEPAVVPALLWRHDRLEAGSAFVRTPRL